MNGDAATLARRFARTLEQLRTSYDVQYVGTRPLPEPARLLDAAAESHDATGEETASSDRLEPTAATAASAPATSTAASVAATAPSPPATATAARGSARAVSAADPTPPEPSSREPVSRPREPVSRPPERTLPLLGEAASPPAASPPREPVGADRQALRAQAQRWSPAEKLEYLRVHNVGDCQRCPLSRTRNRIVFGVGNPQADVMFVGEAPGADEDRQGEPFVGRAGQLLNQWLAQLGLVRDDVYIANVLKCRPPGNRDPRPEETDRCSPFLQAQIRAIEPKVIIALGRHAGVLLSGRDATLHAMRGGRLHYDAGASKADPSARTMIPLVVTYHPAYVLRQEGDGRSPAPGQASPTALVMTDLRRALAIARGSA